ncbi:uncharacterized protein EDB93DRAFT_1257584 [Suillus bovinus]|uniref:uncharacterized protein n=1 Tax=Suillus bovinus TaxID=48563 RepID=UPI001B861BC1|nr:uncharacterized protein EDB93DRAFT_1257584 [Suillus bovinus]KAG2126340.1 hypothetical protein EDB93DRAFT_1257584 [Suillus bovinus]
MPEHNQGDKKPRLNHADLTDADMTAEEKQRERQRRWNTANKRAWRKRMFNGRRRRKDKKKKTEQTGTNAESEEQGPRKRQRVSSPDTHPEAGRSNTAPVDIPIDPVLLNEENELS